MPDDREPLLRVQSLRKTYRVHSRSGHSSGQLVALDGVSFDVRRHQVVGVVGESGSGKTTIARTLVRLEEPDSGAVTFQGSDVLQARGTNLARIRRAMQLIYQDPYSSLNPRMSVARAISEPASVHGLVDRRDTRDYVRQALEMVGLPNDVADRRPHELSGGQRQRVAIARAMAVEPELLLADEAVSALDVSIQAQILNLFAALRSDRGVAILFIAHNLAAVAALADLVQVMYLGVIVESGPTRRVFATPGHPYTAALIGSQPGRHRRDSVAGPTLNGEIPSALAVPSGCRFRTRCPIAQEICHEMEPPTVDLGGGHSSACHFAYEVMAGGRIGLVGPSTSAKGPGGSPGAGRTNRADSIAPPGWSST